jgi:hypothetical protein
MVAGVAATPNTLFVSEANNFTNFTTGTNESDPFAEVIAAPGSRLTHIEYACGRLLWWKDQSFGYMLGTNQNNIQIVTVSNIIGTLDNSSAVDNTGAVWFRGQDGHIYQFDCASVQKKSTDITPNIQTSGQRTSNSYTETSQSDFQAGTIVPTGRLSTTISPFEIVPSSFTATDDVAADWTAGTISSLTVVSGSLRINYNALTQMTNPGAESSTSGWDKPGGDFTSALQAMSCGTVSPRTGSIFFLPGQDFAAQTTFGVDIIDMSGSALTSTSHNASTPRCTWTSGTVSPSSAFYGKAVRVRMRVTGSYGTRYYTTSSSYTLGGDISYWYTNDTTYVGFDDFSGGLSTVSSATFRSRTFDTGITRSYARLTPTYTESTFAPDFVIQDSDDGSAWTEVGRSTTTDFSVRRYVRYISSFTPTSVQDARTTLDSVAIVSRSSGTYYSPVVNKPNLTSWDTLSANTADNGGSHSFYMRSSTNAFSVLSSTPSWTAQTAGAVISISTGTYFQLRDDIAVDASTDVPTLSDFTINWFEGTAGDKAYAIYFNDAVWWSVAFGAGQSTNNYIFKYDMLNNGWTLYNFGTGGFLTQNNRLYFGSVAADGKIYRYGDSTSDAGSAISAYWQSKDFVGADPWLENEYTNIDVIARRNANHSLTVGYTLNASTTTTSFTASLSNATDANIRYKKLLPTGKIGGMFNIKFSDNSSTSAWEVLGFRFTYKPLTYRPTQ